MSKEAKLRMANIALKKALSEEDKAGKTTPNAEKWLMKAIELEEKAKDDPE